MYEMNTKEKGFFSNIKDPQDFLGIEDRLLKIQMKLRKGKDLSMTDETYLRRKLLGKGEHFVSLEHRCLELTLALNKLKPLIKEAMKKGMIDMFEDPGVTRVHKALQAYRKRTKAEYFCVILKPNPEDEKIPPSGYWSMTFKLIDGDWGRKIDDVVEKQVFRKLLEIQTSAFSKKMLSDSPKTV